MICGGEVEVFVEPILSAPTLYIFGGGHVSLPVARMGRQLGFKVVIVEDRAEFANVERFPEAEICIIDSFKDPISKLKLAKQSYIAILTKDHRTDEMVLEQVAKTPARYIGMMGSANKIKVIFSAAD